MRLEGSGLRLAAGIGRGLGATTGGRAAPGPANGSDLAAASAAAEEPIAAIGLEPRHARSRRHLEPLQHLSRCRIDPPQIALVAFPGAVPELAVDPGDPGDDAVGLDGAKDRAGLADRSDGSSGPDAAPPRASLRPRRAPNRRRRRARGSSRARGRSFGSILWMRSSAIWNRCWPSKAVPACAATSIERCILPLAGSKAFSLSPAAIQTCWPSNVTPLTRSTSGKGPYSRRISAADRFMLPS